jgi:hypothetical protein
MKWLAQLSIATLAVACESACGSGVTSDTTSPLPREVHVERAVPDEPGDDHRRMREMSEPLFRPIHPPEAEGLPPLTVMPAAMPNAWSHRHGSCAGNSRTAQTVSKEAKVPAWKVSLPETFEPLYMLAHEDRVVVVGTPDPEGRQPLAVFDASGSLQAQLLGREGAWAIDVRAGLLLGTATQTRPAAWSLRDGSLHATMLLRLGGRDLSSLLACDQALIVGSRERPQLDGPLPNVAIEVVHVQSYDDVNRSRILRGGRSSAAVTRDHDDRLLVAAGQSELLLVMEGGGVAWTDWLLQTKAELRADIVPLGVSVHDDGSARVLVRTPERVEFWMLDVGARRFIVPVGEPFQDAGAPVIHADGTTVLASSARLASYKVDGRSAWAFKREGPPGALADAVGTTLASHREILLAYAPDGKATTVWTAPEPIVTAPIVAGDHLYVCTSTRLYALPT